MQNNNRLAQSAIETKDVIGTDIYVFAPPDRKFFLGEEVLIIGGAIVLQAFFRGFTASAENKIEEWGCEAYEWLSNQISHLIESGKNKAPAPSDDPDLAADWRGAKKAAISAPPEKVEVNAKASQIIIQNIFIEQGLTSAQAQRIGAGVRQAAMATLTDAN